MARPPGPEARPAPRRRSAGGAPATGDGGAGQGGGAGTIQPPPLPLPPLVTSAEGAYWKTDGQLTEVASGAADVTIDDGAVAQRWDGFGGTFSERSADYLSQLSASDKEMALQLLFGPDGLRFNRGRIPIGASDYAIDRYTLDETPGDTSMSQFSIERDKQKLIPYIKAALAVAPGLHLWASPWSPPTWMKSNGAFDGGTMKEDDATLQAFALYLTKFVQEYGKQGIPIEVVHPQKEPNLALDFPSCVWSPAAMTKFIGASPGPDVCRPEGERRDLPRLALRGRRRRQGARHHLRRDGRRHRHEVRQGLRLRMGRRALGGRSEAEEPAHLAGQPQRRQPSVGRRLLPSRRRAERSRLRGDQLGLHSRLDPRRRQHLLHQQHDPEFGWCGHRDQSLAAERAAGRGCVVEEARRDAGVSPVPPPVSLRRSRRHRHRDHRR